MKLTFPLTAEARVNHILDCEVKKGIRTMRISTYGFVAFVTALMVCEMAYAFVEPNQGPAPLLAAGIPAFAALGGGAAITKFARRFRKQK